MIVKIILYFYYSLSMLDPSTAMEMKTTLSSSVLCQESVTKEREKQSLPIERR